VARGGVPPVWRGETVRTVTPDNVTRLSRGAAGCRRRAEDDGRRVAVGVDVGGTKLALGVIDADGRVLAREQSCTPRSDPAVIIERIVGFATRHAAGMPIGIGAAGVVDDCGAVRYGSFIDWRGINLVDAISSRLGVPVVADNDANAAAWAEYCRNRASDDMLLLLALGTGVGGAIIDRGRLVRGAHGLAGELGHIPVDPLGEPCRCGGRGCLETVSGGTAIAATYALSASMAATSARDVHVAALAGDVRAVETIRRAGSTLGMAVATMMTILDPDRVVLCGGLVALGDLLLQPARAAISRHAFLAGQRPAIELEISESGADAVIVGAALLALGGRALLHTGIATRR
jgi:glucokinase